MSELQDGEYKISRLNPEYIILTHKYKGDDDFFCVTPHKGMAMQFENDKFVQISAWHHNNHFSWFDGDAYRILSYEKKSIVDYNKDFIPDVIVCHAKDQKFIIINGKYLPVKNIYRGENDITENRLQKCITTQQCHLRNQPQCRMAAKNEHCAIRYVIPPRITLAR